MIEKHFGKQHLASRQNSQAKLQPLKTNLNSNNSSQDISNSNQMTNIIDQNKLISSNRSVSNANPYLQLNRRRLKILPLKGQLSKQEHVQDPKKLEGNSKLVYMKIAGDRSLD